MTHTVTQLQFRRDAGYLQHGHATCSAGLSPQQALLLMCRLFAEKMSECKDGPAETVGEESTDHSLGAWGLCVTRHVLGYLLTCVLAAALLLEDAPAGS